jgi:hypothetical protein
LGLGSHLTARPCAPSRHRPLDLCRSSSNRRHARRCYDGTEHPTEPPGVPKLICFPEAVMRMAAITFAALFLSTIGVRADWQRGARNTAVRAAGAKCSVNGYIYMNFREAIDALCICINHGESSRRFSADSAPNPIRGGLAGV